ncbi:MAG: hypothetical protein DMG08_18270 [Acidobacteria bacterium]|nr:MAG: hypothetical protein DMG08_18270 [Acidobacteriota bacterium]
MLNETTDEHSGCYHGFFSRVEDTLITNVLRAVGTTGLACYPVGFGCYRINHGNEQHEAALRSYLDRGGNLIDTSANYTDGLSETLAGYVLKDYPRERTIVVTKGGYIQGQNMALAQKHDFPEVVRYQEGLWHCIHPEFLQTQIQLSLDRMQLKKIDVYLLHNPEYFLTEKEHHAGPAPADHEEFYRRVREAFRFLETQVDAGIIGWYGVSSNNFGMPSSEPAMTSVSRCIEEARGLQSGHHFRVVQLPMNLFESGGALEKNNAGRTALEFCDREGIGVLVNRPLNAFYNHRLIRLADFVKPGQQPPGVEALKEILKPLHDIEQRLHTELQAPLAAGGNKGLAATLEEIVPELQSASHWESVAGQHVIRPLHSWLAQCQQRYGRDMRWQAWRQDFIKMVNPLFEDITRHLTSGEQRTSDEVRARLFEAGYPRCNESLSRMAMNVLVHLPGLNCVLNGMRRLKYVADAVGAPELPPVDALTILQNFRRSLETS